MCVRISFNRAIGRMSRSSEISQQTSRWWQRLHWSGAMVAVIFTFISSHAMAQPFPAEFDLGSLASGDGSTGFVLNGVDIADVSGVSVSVVGDINDDGIDDLLIGASGAYYDVGVYRETYLGGAYVVFGREADDVFPAEIELASLATGDGSTGFVLYGERGIRGDFRSAIVAGSRSSGGDLNGDGIDDLIIGSIDYSYTSSGGGSVYIVYGRSNVSAGFPSEFELDDLVNGDGVPGFVFRGAGRVSGKMGDINGDGIDDLYAAEVGEHADSHVVFGRSEAVGGFPAEFGREWIRSGDGSRGFELGITLEFDEAGYAADMGDINGDGIDDLVLSAPRAKSDNLSSAGEVFVIFGRDAAAGAFPDRVSLVSLERVPSDIGFTLRGSAVADYAGKGIGVGDINGDGVDDIVIGTPGADPGGSDNAGATHVVYGRKGGRDVFPFIFELSSLAEGDGSAGFVVNGIQDQDQIGDMVALGDVNDDGIDDIIVGAKSTGRSAGRGYVVFGRDTTAGEFPAELELASLAEGIGVVLDGLDPIARIYSPGYTAGKSLSAGDINGDGVDDVILGDSWANPGGRDDAGITYVVFGRPDNSSSVANLSIDNNPTAKEGNYLKFNVVLSEPVAENVTFDVDTINGTAVSPNDYLPKTGSRMLAAGQTERTIWVKTIDDDAIELNEKMSLRLSNPTNAQLGDDTAVGIIVDNDDQSNKAQLRVAAASGLEGNSARFKVTLSKPTKNDVRVKVTTFSGSAIEGEDFKEKRGIRIIPAGTTQKTIFVELYNDELQESTEHFTLQVTAQSNNVINADDGLAEGTIADSSE